MNLMELCRLCGKLTNSDLTPRNLFIKPQRKLLKQIEQLTGLSLKDDQDMPQLICKHCRFDLEQANEFRERCINSQAVFEQKLRQKMQPEITTIKLKPKRMLRTNPLDTNTEVVAMPENGVVTKDVSTIKEEPQIEEVLCKTELALVDDYSSGGFTHLADFDDPEENPFSFEEKLHAAAHITAVVAAEERAAISIKRSESRNRKAANKPSDFICDQCGNHFSFRHHFLTHLRRHAGDKQFQCEICSCKFFTHSELKRHMRRHTGERPFACKHCERRFTDYSTRIKHERTHTNERPFSCEHCTKAFTTSYILKNHILTHTGERCFRCVLCNKSFQRQTHLAVHNRSIMHKQNEEKEHKLRAKIPTVAN